MSLFKYSTGTFSVSRFFKTAVIAALFLGLSAGSLFAEKIYLNARTSFSNAQFWERISYHDALDNDKEYSQNVFANYFVGSFGVGMEMIIWDVGKKRGSRVYFKTGLDMLFSGPNYYGMYNDLTNSPMTAININGGVFYTGFGFDLYLGGTFPKTDLIWGFGSNFNFMFAAGAQNYNVSSFVDIFHFYATPSILIGYDFFIPNTDFKITPMLKTGFTVMPMISDDLVTNMTTNVGADKGPYQTTSLYSGFYIDLSVAFSFIAFQWKK